MGLNESDQYLAEKISDDVASEAFTNISPNVQTHTKYCILDSIGVMIGGTELPQASVIKKLLARSRWNRRCLGHFK